MKKGITEGEIARWRVSKESPAACESQYPLQTRWVGAVPHPAARSPMGTEAVELEGTAWLEVDDHPALQGQEFTIEGWVFFREPPTGAQVLAERSGEHGLSWQLGLSRHVELEFLWRDDDQHSQRVASIQLVDLLTPGTWLHVAAVFRNHVYTRQPYIVDYSRVHLYCTPLGERFPRIVAQLRGFSAPQITEKPARLFLGSNAGGTRPWQGVLTDLVYTRRAKQANEFPTLGQRPPKDLCFSDDFVAGSVFCPVERSPGDIVIGCTPYTGSGNYWFYTRVDASPAMAGRPISCEVLTVPGGGSMQMSMFCSYDQKQWHRIRQGHYRDERGSPYPGAYSFTHAFERFPAWLCTYIPYTTDDIDALENDLRSCPCVQILTPSRTVEDRPIRLFKITDPSVPDTEKRCVYLQAGQHSPSEMGPGRVLDRAARFLADQTVPAVQDVLKKTVFFFVPIVNVDCCHHGGSGSNLNRVNTNRDWIKATQPETAGLVAFLDAWIAAGHRIDLALDLHSGGCWKNHTVLAIQEDAARAELPDGWFEAQEAFLTELATHTGIGADGDRRYRGWFQEGYDGTFVHALSSRHGIPTLTLEFSHLTFNDGDGGSRAVTQRHLEELGPKFVRACTDWLAS